MDTTIIYKDESYQIIGKCFEVHKVLRHGFLEVVYKDALEIERELCGCRRIQVKVKRRALQQHAARPPDMKTVSGLSRKKRYTTSLYSAPAILKKRVKYEINTETLLIFNFPTAGSQWKNKMAG